MSINLESGVIDTAKWKVNEKGEIDATGGEIGGFTFSANEFSTKITLPYTYTSADVERIRQIIIGSISPTSNDYEKYDLSQNGKIDTQDWLIVGRIANGQLSRDGYFQLNTLNAKKALQVLDSTNKVRASIGAFGSYFSTLTTDNFDTHNCSVETSITADNDKIFIGVSDYNGNNTSAISLNNESNTPTISMYGYNGSIACTSLTQTSLKSKKKNIKKLKVNALELIRNADICLYNIKGEKAKTKKHIGLIIDKDGKYNCPEEVIAESRQGVEQYSMTSLSWKAHQETAKRDDMQDEAIISQKREIEILCKKISILERTMKTWKSS